MKKLYAPLAIFIFTVFFGLFTPRTSFAQSCNYGGGVENAIYTAIGCIPVSDTNLFIAFFLKWALGIAGGIAFLFIVYSGFIITTSSGNPDRLRAGQEMLTSTLSGIMLLIFSIFILEIIGVKILNLPGFGLP